jgi:toxin-antitoxin system PIN domain toxin
MLLLDVNILVYAHRRDAENHAKYRRWLEDLLAADEVFGLADLVLSGFLRVVTHPKVFQPPSAMDSALAFAGEVRTSPNRIRVEPGERHWEIFAGLCRTSGIRGNHVPDDHLAALAIESGCEWITTDRGFSRYPGLRWRHPFE